MKRWMILPTAATPPYVALFRRRFSCAAATPLELEFSGDETVELFLDGQPVAIGPEYDAPTLWHRGEWRGTVAAGTHLLLARLSVFGPARCEHARCSLAPGFYCRDRAGWLDGDWEVLQLTDLEFEAPTPDWGVAPRARVGAAFPWAALHGDGDGWQPVAYRDDSRALLPPAAPPVIGAILTGWQRNDTARRCEISFDHYVCAYGEYHFSGCGEVQLRWAETTYQDDHFDPVWLKGRKGRRDGTCWIGNADEFTIAGDVVWHDWQWRAGTRLELRFTGSARLDTAVFRRAGYPYRWENRFASSEPELDAVLLAARRTLECCSHDTYLDCPYFERMMYVGDARIEALAGYVGTLDTALVEKALATFERSMTPDGMIASRQPAKLPQVIPGFALLYILLLHDFALWRDRPEVVRRYLPTVRRIADYFIRHRSADGLIRAPGWNFIDWVASWENGVPPGSATEGTNSSLNACCALALVRLAELEAVFGTAEQARQRRHQAGELRRSIRSNYFDPERGLLADDRERQHFSEHPQLWFALAFDEPELVAALLRQPPPARAGIYFSHYFLEVCYRYRLEAALHRRLTDWYGLAALGLTTLPEEFDNPRSDCHAWSAHPLYHYYATVLGIRPTAFGAGHFTVRPLPGHIARLSGTLPTPHGEITVQITDGAIELSGSYWSAAAQTAAVAAAACTGCELRSPAPKAAVSAPA